SCRASLRRAGSGLELLAGFRPPRPPRSVPQPFDSRGSPAVPSAARCSSACHRPPESTASGGLRADHPYPNKSPGAEKGLSSAFAEEYSSFHFAQFGAILQVPNREHQLPPINFDSFFFGSVFFGSFFRARHCVQDGFALVRIELLLNSR